MPKRTPKPETEPVEAEIVRSGPGRPSVLEGMSPADRELFLKLLRAGTPQNWACKKVRMTYQTLQNYRDRAANGEEPYAAFILDVDQAQADFVITRLQIHDHDSIGAPLTENRERGNPKAIEWMLERLFPKDFAPVQKTEHTGKDGEKLDMAGPAKVIILPAKETD